MRKPRSPRVRLSDGGEAASSAQPPRAPHSPRPAPNPPTLGDTLADACGFFVAYNLLDRAPATLRCYEGHAGHLVRVYGSLPLRSWTVGHGQAYIAQRLKEGAAPGTLRLELVVLRRVLTLARQLGRLTAAADELMPSYRARYIPRRRFLSEADFERVLDSFPPERRLWLLLATYGGLRSSEVERCEWQHVDLTNGWLLVPGTKTAGSYRRIPLHGRVRAVLGAVEEHHQGALVPPWRNVRRALAQVCATLGLERCSPNDLRRTFASWLKQRHVDSMVVAQLLGHSSTRMVELVYGRLDTRTLADAVAKLPDGSKPERT